MSAPPIERVWDAERRARELVTRRDELVRRLPREIRAAGRLTEDVRELIVDDAIEFAALRYDYPVTCTRELERAFWDACAKRTRRGLERRYDTVRGRFTRADEHAIDTLAGDHDPAAELERAQERALAREFAATLEPHERRVLVCKYDTDGSEPAGYKVIARRLGLGIGRVRSAERSIERKIERFAAVYAAGRLCDVRETAVTALAAGTADSRQATTALAHVKHCGHCRPFYAQQLRELGSDAFGRKVASLLPVAELQQRGRLRGAWDAIADTLARPFTHEGATTAAQLAAGGVGRGAGTIALLKLVGACMASATAVGVCATALVIPAVDNPARLDKPARKVAEREGGPVGQHGRLPSRAEHHVTPTPTPTPKPRRSQVARDSRRRQLGGVGPSDHEQAPASPAPANAAAGGESEFDPTYTPNSPPQPAPVQAAPGSGEFLESYIAKLEPSMTHTHLLARRIRSATAAAGIAALLLLSLAAQARAGSYTVSGSCGWQPWNGTPTISVYAAPDPDNSCPALSMETLSPTPPGAAGGWTFYAPSGTSIISGAFYAWADAHDGWQAAIYRSGGGASGSSWLNCPGGDGCQANPGNQWVSGPGYNASAAVAHLRCNRSTTCTRGAALQLDGSASVGLQDDVLPSVTLTGAGASGDWLAGTPPVIIDATDNTGIRDTLLLIDGGQQRAVSHGCDYRNPVPCSNQRTALDAPTTIFPDGRHTLTVQTIDAAGNTGAASRQLLIDNSAPTTPQAVDVTGGIGWRAQPTRRITWANPPQRFAPITAARYSLCPAEADSSNTDVAAKAKAACVSGQQPVRDVSEVPELQLPKPGAWTLRLWLVDAAGNADPDSAAVIGGLGYDPTPPEVAGFAAQDPDEPTRVSVFASDDTSPLEGGAIEIQRRGARVWRPLTTEIRGAGISALVDDERLRKGRYRLRATVTNAAGLQQGTDRAVDGQRKMLRLPIRLASRLQSGRRVGKVCRHWGAKRRCRWKLRRTVPVALGRRITLRGRLTVRGKPVREQPVEVWQRPSVTGTTWQLTGSVQTNRRGRYRYKTAAGVARRLRFRYPGTAHIRGDNATVVLRVLAKTTLAVSRRRVINGEYVTFSGRLKGGHRPPAGVLVELQVRSRGKWRTFAQPRADGATGAWSYQYRFETVSGGARFRFRARVRRQAGYPFATGNSRTIGVSVHGL